jgi:UMP-CMP kinase
MENNNNNDNNDDESEKIQQIAYESLSITGSLPRPSNFAGIPYLDTSTLDINNPTTTKSHRVIFVLGGPGAGKGTQSERIVDKYKCVHLSVGELLRQGAQDESYEYANLIRETLIAGNIVPVELSLGLLRTAMDKATASTSSCDEEEKEDGSKKYYGSRIFLIDGFPRNYDNIKGWVSCMTHQASVLGALVYDCPMDELERRILSRAETSGRSDDNIISARKRFDTFRRETKPVVLALERVQKLQADENGRSQLNVVNIDASGSVDDVWEATRIAMDDYVKNDILTANSNLLRAIDEGDVASITKLSNEDELIDDVNPLVIKETTKKIGTTSISNGRIDIVDGVKSIVSYDRILGGGMKVRETRIWEHGSSGWKCIGVTRV